MNTQHESEHLVVGATRAARECHHRIIGVESLRAQ
jgi:hypothetical protein